MSSLGIRTWLLVGAGFGLLAAIMVVLFNATVLGLLLEAIFAIVAGALTVYLNRGMVVPTAAPPSGGPPVSARGFWARQGALAGAAVGVLGGVAYTIVASALINGASFQAQLESTLQAQGAQGLSTGSIMGIATACIGCFYILFIPSVTAGLGALGAWVVRRTQPGGAAVPPPPPPGAFAQPPLPVPPESPDDAAPER